MSTQPAPHPSVQTEKLYSFRLYFNGHKQWLDIYLDDVTPATFAKRSGSRWGYFSPTPLAGAQDGEFGEIHLVASRVRPDLVTHELAHAWIEWMRARKIVISGRNEERLVRMLDGLVGAFYREYGKMTLDRDYID